MLHHGQKIGQNLGGMVFVGEPVPYRNTCIFSQFFNNCLSKTTVFDAIIHASQNTGGVFHGFFLANLRSAWSEVGNFCSLVVCSGFKSTAGAGGSFFKNQGNIFSF